MLLLFQFTLIIQNITIKNQTNKIRRYGDSTWRRGHFGHYFEDDGPVNTFESIIMPYPKSINHLKSTGKKKSINQNVDDQKLNYLAGKVSTLAYFGPYSYTFPHRLPPTDYAVQCRQS